MGTEGFAVLAAAANGMLVVAPGGSTLDGGLKHSRGLRLGVQSQPLMKSSRVSLAMGGTDSFGKSWSSENMGWCSAGIDLCTWRRKGQKWACTIYGVMSMAFRGQSAMAFMLSARAIAKLVSAFLVWCICVGGGQCMSKWI